MKHPFPRVLGLLLLFSCLSACTTTSDVVPMLASDDYGPQPRHPQAIAAVWFNYHCRFTPPNPVRPEELFLSEPSKVATVDLAQGRIVGWQVILGPENKIVTDYTDAKYTRLIINRGRIVSVTSSDRPFLSVPK